MCPPGVLGNSDRWVMEIACVLMSRFRACRIDSLSEAELGQLSGEELKALMAARLSGAELSQLGVVLGKMGLSPADRSKVVVSGNEAKANPFANLDDETETGTGPKVN
jgi:hypothetical protein